MKLPFLAVVGLTAAVASGADHKPVLWRPSGKKDHGPWKKFCGSTPCWDVLEVPFGATEEQVKKSYRKLTREWHPDKNPEKGARAKFQKIAKVYEVRRGGPLRLSVSIADLGLDGDGLAEDSR